MVIKVPDSYGNLLSKGRIIIPCQCYYNARDDLLTEIIQHTHNHPNDYQISLDSIHNTESSRNNYPAKNKTEKIIRNGAGDKKNVSTETTDYCCVCEHFRKLESRKNKKDLWNMQFSRWWGWNWQRKRKDLLSKFGLKCDKDCNENSKHHVENIKNKKSSDNRDNEDLYNINKQKQAKNTENDNLNFTSYIDPLKPAAPSSTYGFKKPYKGRRKRKRHKYRQYEGWIREVHSSDSENSEEKLKLKMRSPKKPSNKEYLRYLSLRLRKINSEDSSDEDKTIECKKNDEDRVKTIFTEPTKDACFILADANYVSPISGKTYNLDLPKTSVPFIETNDTDFLNPINIKDETIIPKPKFDWMTHYNLMKNEHSELLKSICDVIHTGKIVEQSLKSSEEVIREIDLQNYESKQINLNNSKRDLQSKVFIEQKFGESVAPKTNEICDNEFKTNEVLLCNVKTNKQQDYQKCNFQTYNKDYIEEGLKNIDLEKRIQLGLRSINIKAKSLTDNTTFHSEIRSSTSLKIQPVQILTSNSSNIFYKDAIQFENTNNSVSHEQEENDKNKLNYDLNYISNNLLSFSSTISDTEFLFCQSDDSDNNVTENCSEHFITQINLQNN